MKTEEIDRKIGMPDVDQEWARFEREVIDRPHLASRKGRWMNRAAMLTLVCVLGGLAVAMTYILHRPSVNPAAPTVVAEEAIAPQAEVPTVTDDAARACIDEEGQQLVFDDVELQTIARCLELTYGVEPVFVSDEARRVRIYATLQCQSGIDEIVNLLNSFERVQIRLDGQRLIIE